MSDVRRVLLTGGTGFIGSHCIQPLLDRGYEVIATHRGGSPKPKRGVRWVQADLLDASARARVIDEAKASHMLHMAWYVEPGKLITHPDNLSWCSSSIDLVHRFHRVGGTRVAVGGSCYEYDWRYGFCNETLTPRQPDTLYGAAKNGLHDILLGYCRSSGLSGAWGRLFFLYGPEENPARLVPAVIRALLAGKEAATSHGRQIRDYAYVQDVADGLVAMLDSSAQGGFNIASGEARTIVSMVEAIGSQLGRSELLRVGAIAARPNDAPLVVADIAAAKREFGWEPKTTMAEGLAKTIDWWRQRN